MDARQFRNALSRFASGVTIITTRHADHTHGMTANAFVSVSLHPPLVLVSVDNRTHMNSILPPGQRYGVSVLSEAQEALSDHFAGRGHAGAAVEFVHLEDVPLIAGAVAHLVARVVEAHPAGDHTLYIGQVEFLDWHEGMPLLFYSGKYQRLRVAPPKPSPWQVDEFSLFSIGTLDPSIPAIHEKRPA